MKFTREEQLKFAVIALRLSDLNKEDQTVIESLLSVGESIKKDANEENAVIYDITEYLYEQLRLLSREEGATDGQEFRESIEALLVSDNVAN